MADREYVVAGPEKVNLLDTADQDLIRVRVRGDTYDRYVLQGDGTLASIRLAHSTDGIAWTDQNFTSWAKGVDGTYDDTYKEWHQILQIGGVYVLVSECYDGDRWTIGMAASSTLTGVFTKLSAPIFEPSGAPGTFDRYHVATPAIYKIGGRWYLFYQGTDIAPPTNYSFGYWSMGVAEFAPTV